MRCHPSDSFPHFPALFLLSVTTTCLSTLQMHPPIPFPPKLLHIADQTLQGGRAGGGGGVVPVAAGPAAAAAVFRYFSKVGGEVGVAKRFFKSLRWISVFLTHLSGTWPLGTPFLPCLLMWLQLPLLPLFLLLQRSARESSGSGQWSSQKVSLLQYS